MTFVIFFIFGTIIGSFLNVVIHRVHTGEGLVRGRSHCPRCKAVIRWYDNIPIVSFLFLGGKCRKCKKKISWQYPMVEFFTGVLFLWVGIYFFNIDNLFSFFPTFYYLVIISFFIVIFVYDALYMEIPGPALWPAIGFAVLGNLVMDWMKPGIIGGPMNLATYSGAAASLFAFMFFFLLVAYSKEKWMGMGDALLAILLGLVLGWPNILLALFLAFAIGAIYGIILLAVRSKTLKSQIPFAPFLIIGSVIALFFCVPIINWYKGLFNF